MPAGVPTYATRVPLGDEAALWLALDIAVNRACAVKPLNSEVCAVRIYFRIWMPFRTARHFEQRGAIETLSGTEGGFELTLSPEWLA